MKAANKPKRTYKLDWQKLEYLRLKDGLTIEELTGKLNMDIRTYEKLRNDGSVMLGTAKAIAEKFQIELTKILHDEELFGLGPPETWGVSPSFFSKLADWEPVQCLESQRIAANGLKIEVWEMSHFFMPERKGRGKCYDLAGVTRNTRTKLREYFTRHAQVCDRVGNHPRIVKNFTVTPDDDNFLWWVIDEKVGPTLEGQLVGEKLSQKDAVRILCEILEGLQALHKAGVIYREMSPSSILLRESDQSVVLTDFELAKLLEGRPTVAPEGNWPAHEYRAMEVGPAGVVGVEADLYSWGRIAARLLTGELPFREKESEALSKIRLPPSVLKTLQACLELPASKRPSSASQVLKVMRAWK